MSAVDEAAGNGLIITTRIFLKVRGNKDGNH
jgi:hypothetical protein